MRLLVCCLWFSGMCYAQSLSVADIKLYAREGLARICVDSRNISGSERRELKSKYRSIYRMRKATLPADNDFSYYAAEQLWGVGIRQSPRYDECVALLR